MDPTSLERKLAAILSADVVGYSRLMAEDEVATVRTLTAYREEIGVLVRHSGGAVGAVLALLFLLPLLVPALGVAALQGVLPTVAGQALMGLPTPFSAVLSMVLAVLWAVVPLAAAIWSLNRRDA